MFNTIIRACSIMLIGAVVTACAAPAVVPTPTSVPTATLPTPTSAPTAVVPTSTSVPTAVSAARLDTVALDAFVKEMLKAYDVPGAAISIVQADGTTYTQGYGVRDTTTNTSVTADTQFAIASVTKSFTALGIMLLVQEGKINLDDPVTRYLPNFRLADTAATAKVTVRHLLMHTTGMERNNAATGNPNITRDEVVALAAETPLVAAPGEKHIYSNINTVAAGRIIELVSGQSWEEFTRTRILRPLGMQQATLDVAAMQQQPNYAMPHDMDLLAGMLPSTFLDPAAEAPAGGINASAAEMSRYLQFQLGDGTVDGTRLLSAESLAEMHRRQIAVDETGPVSQAALIAQEQGVPAPESLVSDFGYGLYWYTEQFQGHRVVQHDGQTLGFSASTNLVPEKGVGVVILTNANYAFGFVEAVRSHILEELLTITPRHDTYAIVEAQLALLGRDQASIRKPMMAVRTFTADPARLEALAGSYTNLMADSPTIITVADGRKLLLETSLQGFNLKVDLLPYGDNAFLVNSSPIRGYQVEFSTKADGTNILLNGTPIAKR